MPLDWLFLFLGIACLVGLMVLLAVRRFDPRLVRCVEPTDTGYRVRLNGWDRDAYVLLFGGVLSILTALMWFAGAAVREPAWQAAAALIPAAVILWLTRAEPFTQFLTDDAENGTLSWPGGSVRRDDVAGVEVVGNEVRLVGSEPLTVARFRRTTDAEALAWWLADRLNVRV